MAKRGRPPKKKKSLSPQAEDAPPAAPPKEKPPAKKGGVHRKSKDDGRATKVGGSTTISISASLFDAVTSPTTKLMTSPPSVRMAAAAPRPPAQAQATTTPSMFPLFPKISDLANNFDCSQPSWQLDGARLAQLKGSLATVDGIIANFKGTLDIEVDKLNRHLLRPAQLPAPLLIPEEHLKFSHGGSLSDSWRPVAPPLPTSSGVLKLKKGPAREAAHNEEEDELVDVDIVDDNSAASLIPLTGDQQTQGAAQAAAGAPGRKRSGTGLDKKNKRARIEKKKKGNQSEVEGEVYAHPPSSFWGTIEPYLAPLTDSDLGVVDSLMSDPPETLVIPPLGRHYIEVWMMEDAIGTEHRKEPAPSSKKGKKGGGSSSSGAAADSAGGATTVDMVANAKTPRVRHLTSRILQGLMEERLISAAPPAGAPTVDVNDENVDLSINIAPTAHYSVNAMATLEERIKMELRNIGLLEDNEPDLTKREDDEVCGELRTVWQQLKEQVESNRQACTRLRSLCAQAVVEANHERQVRLADSEVERQWRALEKKSSGKKKK